MQQPDVEEQIDYSNLFNKERSEWKEKISVLAIRMKNIREVAEVQVDLYSSRQMLLEYSYKLGQILVKLKNRYRKERGERMRHYSESSQIKYGTNEKTPLIEGDLSSINERIDMVDNHMGYLNETIKTVDHMLFGIKNRIYLQEFMSGQKSST